LLEQLLGRALLELPLSYRNKFSAFDILAFDLLAFRSFGVQSFGVRTIVRDPVIIEPFLLELFLRLYFDGNPIDGQISSKNMELILLKLRGVEEHVLQLLMWLKRKIIKLIINFIN
jgi:hypothetical protein